MIYTSILAVFEPGCSTRSSPVARNKKEQNTARPTNPYPQPVDSVTQHRHSLAVNGPQHHLSIGVASDNNRINRPGLPSIRCDEVAGRIRRSKRLVICRICCVHDDLGVQVLVAGDEAAGSLLALDCCTPALGMAALYGGRQVIYNAQQERGE